MVDITTLTLFRLFSVCWFIHCPLYMEGRERPKKKADHARLVGGRFNKPRALTYKVLRA